MKAISKLTAKHLAGGAIAAPAKDTRVLLATVYGEVRGFKITPSRFDPTKTDLKCLGHFEAITAEGMEFSSGIFYPPGGMADMLEAAGEGTSFAVRIFIVPSDVAPKGYAFDFESAIEQKPDERLAMLRNAVKALPAPVAPDFDLEKTPPQVKHAAKRK